jgi:hypothetical protein
MDSIFPGLMLCSGRRKQVAVNGHGHQRLVPGSTTSFIGSLAFALNKLRGRVSSVVTVLRKYTFNLQSLNQAGCRVYQLTEHPLQVLTMGRDLGVRSENLRHDSATAPSTSAICKFGMQLMICRMSMFQSGWRRRLAASLDASSNDPVRWSRTLYCTYEIDFRTSQSTTKRLGDFIDHTRFKCPRLTSSIPAIMPLPSPHHQGIA